jgi:hypothetical protein
LEEPKDCVGREYITAQSKFDIAQFARQPRKISNRDMNKGFANVIIKSVSNGLKETMIMLKGNRKIS